MSECDGCRHYIYCSLRLASVVYVLNVGGYIGESTANEIAYAESLGKVVSYLEPILARRTTPSQSGGE